MAEDSEAPEPPPSALREAFRRRRQQAERRRLDGPRTGGDSTVGRDPRRSPSPSTLTARTPSVKVSATSKAAFHATARMLAPLPRTGESSQKKIPHTAPTRYAPLPRTVASSQKKIRYGTPTCWSDSDSSSGDFFEVTSKLVAERNRLRQKQQLKKNAAAWGDSDSESEDFSIRQIIIKSNKERRRPKSPDRGAAFDRRLHDLGLIGNGARMPTAEKTQRAMRSSRLGREELGKGRKETRDDREAVDAENESHCSSAKDTTTTGGSIDYGTIPEVPEQLDKYEHKVYTKLKTLRFHLKKEKEVERHNKIVQDKTLCELIRRRRNNAGFASRKSHWGDGNAVKADLMSVWGIGPSKAARDSGVGWQLMDALDAKDNAKLLKLSRRGVKCRDIECDSEGGKSCTRSDWKRSKAKAPSSPKIPRYIAFERRS